MIEKNLTVTTTVHELAQYPHPVFTLVQNFQRNLMSMIKDSIDYVFNFDLSVYKKNLNINFKKRTSNCEKLILSKNPAILK